MEFDPKVPTEDEIVLGDLGKKNDKTLYLQDESYVSSCGEKTKNCCARILRSFMFNFGLGALGTGAIVTGSLAAKGIIVLGAISGILAAKILIPIGLALLLALTINLIVQKCCKKNDYSKLYENRIEDK